MLALGAQLLVSAAVAAAPALLAGATTLASSLGTAAVEVQPPPVKISDLPPTGPSPLAHDRIGSLLDARASVSDISAALEGVADLRLHTAIDDTGAKTLAVAMRWNASVKSLSIESTTLRLAI